MITGTQNPVVGKEEFYQYSDVLDPFAVFNSSNITYVWNIWKKKNGSWLNITEKPPKMGLKVPFKFGEKVIGDEFKLQVYKATKKVFSEEFDAKSVGEILLVPTSSKVSKIDRVVLFNGGAKDPNKATYKDTLIARAYCIAMFNQEVQFNLWEDDAPNGGHNASINKNNQLPQTFKARVNEKGIAEVKISLLSNASVLKAIANKYMMSGDKSEGENHEFYVTASYAGKIQKASQENVDVANPDYKTKPKEDSPKFPSTTASKTKKQPDAKGDITDAYFVNDKNQKLASVLVGSPVKVQILSNNMVGKYIQYVVWEKDFGFHDEIYRSGRIKIPGDIATAGGFTITDTLFKKGIDSPIGDPDSDKQNYFIEIIVLDSTAESKKFGIDDKAGQPMEVVRSATVVEKKEISNKGSTENNKCCLIDEEYFLKNYEKEFPTKDKQGKIILLPQESKNSLRKVFKSISEYYGNEKKCCNKFRIAYMLATVKHETGHTFNPVEEANWLSWKSRKKYFEDMYDPVLGKNETRKNKAIEIGNTSPGDGVKYYGRGYVQITGKTNYQKMTDKFNVDFINDMTKVTEHEWAMKILIYGSEDGVFTGKNLSKYISDSKQDYTNARRVINGTDKAATIAGYAEKIEKCLKITECNCGDLAVKKEEVNSAKPIKKYNVDEAVSKLNGNVASKSLGKCAKYVRIAIEAGGLSTEGRPVSAKNYDKFLPKLGFTEITTTNYTPLKGDISVIQSIEGYIHGHICMYDGSQWVSDFKQRTMMPGSAYRKNPPRYNIYRWQ